MGRVRDEVRQASPKCLMSERIRGLHAFSRRAAEDLQPRIRVGSAILTPEIADKSQPRLRFLSVSNVLVFVSLCSARGIHDCVDKARFDIHSFSTIALLQSVEQIQDLLEIACPE
jgi:hypothetical protein